MGIGSRQKMVGVLDFAKYGNISPRYGQEVDTSQNQSQLYSDNAVRSISVVSIFIASYYFQIYNNIFCKKDGLHSILYWSDVMNCPHRSSWCIIFISSLETLLVTLSSVGFEKEWWDSYYIFLSGVPCVHLKMWALKTISNQAQPDQILGIEHGPEIVSDEKCMKHDIRVTGTLDNIHSLTTWLLTYEREGNEHSSRNSSLFWSWRLSRP